MIFHKNLIRLKDYDDDANKFASKSKRAVTRIMKNNKAPIMVVIYSKTCGHCVDFMTDPQNALSEWNKARKRILKGNKTLVLQMNFAAIQYFIKEAQGVPRLERMVIKLNEINAVPIAFGVDAKGNIKEYNKSMSSINLIKFATELKNKI